jgi:hypothetical protein
MADSNHFQNQYSSVSFSSACRDHNRDPNPNQYTIVLPNSIPRVQQIRLGTLELPAQVQPNVVTGVSDTVIVQESGSGNSTPEVTLQLPEGFYSATDLVGEMNRRLNHGIMDQQQPTFTIQYKVQGDDTIQNKEITLNDDLEIVMFRTDVLEQINTQFDAELAITKSNTNDIFCTMTETGHLQFHFLQDDGNSVEALDFQSTAQEGLNLLGVDATLYYPTENREPLVAPHAYFPTYHEYTVAASNQGNAKTFTIDTNLDAVRASYLANFPLVAVQETSNKAWKIRYLAGIAGNQVTLATTDQKVAGVTSFDATYNVVAGATVRFFPELMNRYRMSGSNQKFRIQLVPTTDANNVAYYTHAKILQQSLLGRTLGLGTADLPSNAQMTLAFPNQYHVDPPPYILLYVTNLTCSQKHQVLHPSDSADFTTGRQPHAVSTPLAKIVQTSVFHINRNQIMELDLAGQQTVRQLRFEFRNPDGSLVNFQQRDHHMTIGFVHAVRPIKIGTSH